MSKSISSDIAIIAARHPSKIGPHSAGLRLSSTVSGLSNNVSSHSHRASEVSRPDGEGSDNELQVVESALGRLESAVYELMDRRVGHRGIPLRLIRQARHQYRMRRRCDALAGGLVGEPAWDMLLELFISSAEGRTTPVKNLCLAACASMSTATRRLESLVASGLVQKSDDDADARRSLVELTDRGWDLMTTLLQVDP